MAVNSKNQHHDDSQTTLSYNFETPSGCYRGRKPQNCPKWLGAGAKGVLASWREGLPRVSCTRATLFCTSATLFRTSATGLGPHTPKHLLHPLLTTLGNFEVSGICSRHFANVICVAMPADSPCESSFSLCMKSR